MATRLRLARIEAKAKRVMFVPGHVRTVPLTAEQEAALLEIRDRIEKGYELRPYHYRVNRDSTRDDLLEREGILHLHLSPKDRDATLFLVQYADHVVLLCVSNHSAFKEDPPGSTLARLHAHAINELEAGIDAEVASRSAARKDVIRRSLRPRAKPRA